MAKMVLRRIPLFVYYDLLFSILFLLLFRIKMISPYFSILFLFGILFTIAEISWRILIKYDFLSNLNWQFWSWFLFFGFLENCFVYVQYSQERFIYFWDAQNYWTLSIEFSQQYFQSFVNALRILYRSILYSDYNFFPTILLSLPLKFINHNYPTYAMSINNIYLLPTLLLLAILLKKILTDNCWQSGIATFYAVSVPFLFTLFTIPLMRGYLDSAGLFFIVLLIMSIYGSRFIHVDIERNLYLGLLIVLLIITRRWYGYYVVAFLFSFGLASILDIVFSHEKHKVKQLTFFLMNMFIVGLADLLILVIFFKNFIIKSISSNYAVTYSAWQNGTLWVKVISSINYVGVLSFLMIIVGIFSLARAKKTRFLTANLVLQLILSYVLFNRVQSFGKQHYYLITIPLCIFLVIGAYRLVMLFSSSVKLKSFAAVVIMALLTWNFAQTYFPITAQFRTTTLFSKATAYPRIRYDLSEVHRLVDKLRHLSNDNKKIYILASSPVLNDGIVMRADAPRTLVAVPNLLRTNHVDLRDGFPMQFFQADYVVVADPIQFHLDPDNQRVIGILAQGILTQSFTNFSPIKAYRLENNVNAIIYKKTAPFSKESIREISSSFKKYYKNNPGFSHINAVKQ